MILTPQRISLVVPVYNGGENWVRVLEAMRALNPAPGEIIVVDDGSTDESSALARARGFHVLTTPLARGGPAIARNLGAAHAQGDVLFFLDADVLVKPDAIARVTTALADTNLSAIFGAYDDAPDDPAFVSQYRNLLHHYIHQTSSENASSFWAGCGAIRKRVFDELDGFAAEYGRPSIEDIELGNRLRKAGGHVRLVKDLQVKHLKRWTLRSLIVTDVRDRALPWAQLIARQGELPADLNLKISHRISAVLCWLLVAAMFATLVSPLFWFFALAIALGLLAFNFDLYRFLFKQRGARFAVRALPLHWLYYLYSSATFAYVILFRARLSKARAQPTASGLDA